MGGVGDFNGDGVDDIVFAGPSWDGSSWDRSALSPIGVSSNGVGSFGVSVPSHLTKTIHTVH